MLCVLIGLFLAKNCVCFFIVGFGLFDYGQAVFGYGLQIGCWLLQFAWSLLIGE